MKMIVVKPVRIGAQPNCKPSATGTMGHPQEITNPLVRAIPPLLNGDSPAVGKHERRDIGRIGACMFGQAPAYLIVDRAARVASRSEEHTSELQSLMRISYAVFCLQKKKTYYT